MSLLVFGNPLFTHKFMLHIWFCKPAFLLRSCSIQVKTLSESDQLHNFSREHLILNFRHTLTLLTKHSLIILQLHSSTASHLLAHTLKDTSYEKLISKCKQMLQNILRHLVYTWWLEWKYTYSPFIFHNEYAIQIQFQCDCLFPHDSQ